MIDFKTFFEQSEGKWFTQRTQYNLAQKKVENGQAELTVELLSLEDRAIADLYEQAVGQFPDYISTHLSHGAGAKISWDAEGEKGSNLILLVTDDTQQQQGKLIQKKMSGDPIPTVGHFTIGEDEALTLSTTAETNSIIKERLWFAHPNLRLRTVWQENETGHQGWVMFYSEIRRITS
jgi:hypothetical protein